LLIPSVFLVFTHSLLLLYSFLLLFFTYELFTPDLMINAYLLRFTAAAGTYICQDFFIFFVFILLYLYPFYYKSCVKLSFIEQYPSLRRISTYDFHHRGWSIFQLNYWFLAWFSFSLSNYLNLFRAFIVLYFYSLFRFFLTCMC